VSGFFLGLFVGTDLLLLGVVPLNSVVLTILPVVGLVIGLVLAYTVPKRGRAPVEEPVPEPVVATGATPSAESTSRIDQYVPPPPVQPSSAQPASAPREDSPPL
jgi:hypothetical protein